MTHVDKLILLAHLFLDTLVIVSGEWVELPKLTREDVPSVVTTPKQSEPTTSTTMASVFHVTTTPTTPSTVFLENDYASNNDFENSSTNHTYTFLDPKLESVLIKAHQVLVEEARHPIKHKLRFLKRLQNSILNQIWRRSQFLWTSDNLEGRGHGHMMSFPSLEGALMTISFLTFAAFLIKIVKQFLQGLQGANNTNFVSYGFPITPVPPAKVIHHRRDYNYDYSDLERILYYINELKINHKHNSQ